MPEWDSYEVGLDLVRGTGGTGGTGSSSTPPPDSRYQNIANAGELVEINGFLYDAWTGKWYDMAGNPVPPPGFVTPPDPNQNKVGPNRPGPVESGGLGSNSVGPNPGDGPITTPVTGPVPSAPMSGPGSVRYLGSAAPWTPQAPQQIANPMPGRPQIGTAPMQAYQAWALRQGAPAGAGQAFTPWGAPMGQVSGMRGYGGSPGVTSQGGFAGMSGGSGPALPPITTGGGWNGSWTGSGGTGTGGGLPGRTGGTGGTGGTLPPSGGAGGLPGRVNPPVNPPQDDPVVSTIGGITQSQMDALRRMRTRNTADQPADINPLTVNQLRLLLATQGAILRGQ